MPPVSFGELWTRQRGIAPGFDLVRLVLAIAVLIWHAFQLPYGEAYSEKLLASPVGATVYAIVPGFFALSGYLVSASLARIRHVRAPGPAGGLPSRHGLIVTVSAWHE